MPAIDTKTCIDGYDWPCRKLFAEANQAKVGEIGSAVLVFSPQCFDALLAGVEIEVHADQSGVDQGENVRHGAQMKGGFGQHRFTREQRL